LDRWQKSFWIDLFVTPRPMSRSRSGSRTGMTLQIAASPSRAHVTTVVKKRADPVDGVATGIGALTVSLHKSARARQRARRKHLLDGGESVQVCNKQNLPLTLALHSDFIEKNHIDKVGILHKDLLKKSEKRLNTTHDKWVIEQWNFAHNKRVPFPHIPIPLTLKRGTSSDGITHYWKTLQTHNELIRKAKNTIDSYLPDHVMKMRQRKERNRAIILQNHKRSVAKDRQYRRRKKASARKNRHTMAASARQSGTLPRPSSAGRRRRTQPRPASAQKQREWKFQDAVVAETLAMYGGLAKTPDDRGLGRGRLESTDGQQNHAGLSAKYLRSSLSSSVLSSIPRRARPQSAQARRTPGRAMLSTIKSFTKKKVGGRGGGGAPTMTIWASNLAATEEIAAGVNLLRHSDGTWVGVKTAAVCNVVSETPKTLRSLPSPSQVPGTIDTPMKREVYQERLKQIVAVDSRSASRHILLKKPSPLKSSNRKF
jgi:hypothetical protein